MLGIGTGYQSDLDYKKTNEFNQRIMAMRFRAIDVLEKMNPEEMTLNDLTKYTALLSSVGLLFPYAYSTDCCCESKEG